MNRRTFLGRTLAGVLSPKLLRPSPVSSPVFGRALTSAPAGGAVRIQLLSGGRMTASAWNGYIWSELKLAPELAGMTSR